jgi:hypothetical protein
MASQFADLYEKVDGFSSYQVLIDVAAGHRPTVRRRRGAHRFAASCIFRTFRDAQVRRAPSDDDVAAVHDLHPDARVEIFARAGEWLSEAMQDRVSYRYGLVNLGGRNLADVKHAAEECLRMLKFEFEPAGIHLRRHLP